jgi:uncharacterized protein YbjT (DUF2867 family)
MKIIVTGASGLVGAEVVRQAMMDNEIHEIIALVRRPLDIPHVPRQGGEKLRIVVHQNFLSYSMWAELFREQDACLWCLGISQSQVTEEEYHTITYDYTLEAAKAMLKANPSIAFLFVSGGGADSTEKSKTLFARVKGKTENALLRLPFKKLFIVRPGGIKPVHKNKNAALANKIMIPFFPILELLIPNMVISSVQLAKVLLHIAKHGAKKTLLENVDLKQVFQEISRH